MSEITNEFGQPIGPDVEGWQGAARPSRSPMKGRYCTLEPLDVEAHAEDLFDAYSADPEGSLWTYMPVGPFTSRQALDAYLSSASESEDPIFFAIVDLSTGKALGLATFMRIKPDAGVIEVGNISYSPTLQRTAMATEAMFLMMARAFDELGYRRYEWKCDALNAASRRAADRLGFSFDGIFEQALVYKGRNRDTAWYSILDRDWPRLKRAYEQWLNSKNFDDKGRQRQSLASFMAP